MSNLRVQDVRDAFRLIQALFPISTSALNFYDVAQDAQPFLVSQSVEEKKSQPLTVVINRRAGALI